jgi:site-specific recombinase XerD
MERLLEAAGQAREGLACRDGAILLLLMETGLKVGELVEIRVSDLQLEGEASPELRGTLLVGQNGSGRRLSLRSRVCQALEACLEMRALKPAREENGEDGHLFVNRQGQPLSVRSVQRLVSRYAQQAGLEGVSTRTLRHTFARRVLRRDLEPVQVARMLGLRDVSGVRRYLD